MNEVLTFIQALFADAGTLSPESSTGYVAINVWQLVLAIGFVVLAGLFSVRYRLRLERDLTLGTVRLFVQLFAVGYVLHLVFAFPSMWLVLGMYLITTWFATTIAKRKVKIEGVNLTLPTFAAMTISCFFVTLTVSAVIIRAEPWWTPQYFIPIGGMVAGNAMNSLSIALERFFTELRLRRSEVECMLCLGASPIEASMDMFRSAMRAGMINPINAMMGVGLVSLPGMMTGQILAGVSPVQAVRYQVVVILMITAAAALSSFVALRLVQRRCFTQSAALRNLS